MKKEILYCPTITINTDASYSPQHNVGGYAFYIKCNHFFLKGSGPLKGRVHSSHEAEIKAIGNAFAALLARGELPRCSWLIINTDSVRAIERIKNPMADFDKKVHTLWLKLRKRTKVKGAKSKFRHVKAHNGAPDARSWVNDWCDINAKKHMRALVYKQQPKTQRLYEYDGPPEESGAPYDIGYGELH